MSAAQRQQAPPSDMARIAAAVERGLAVGAEIARLSDLIERLERLRERQRREAR